MGTVCCSAEDSSDDYEQRRPDQCNLAADTVANETHNDLSNNRT